MKYDGKTLKELARVMMKLTPEEAALYEQTEVKTLPRETLQGSHPRVEYDVLADTTLDESGNPVIGSQEDYPIIPRMTFENINAFGTDGYVTEPEIMAHELGHVRDLRSFGRTNEPSAIAFGNNILARSVRTNKPRASFPDGFSLKRSVDPVLGSKYFFRPTIALESIGLSPSARQLMKYQI